MKGNIYLLTDFNTIMPLAPTHTIICISGEAHMFNDFIHATNAAMGTILLPSYDAMSAELDGDLNRFYHVYFEQLYKKESIEFIAVIIKALMLGRNIILFCTEQESNMTYVKALRQFFIERFGILIGYKNEPCMFNDAYMNIICNILYFADLITADELFMMYPENVLIQEPNVIGKLATELQPYVGKPSMEAYFSYFNSHLLNVKSVGKPLIIPVRMNIGGM